MYKLQRQRPADLVSKWRLEPTQGTRRETFHDHLESETHLFTSLKCSGYASGQSTQEYLEANGYVERV